MDRKMTSIYDRLRRSKAFSFVVYVDFNKRSVEGKLIETEVVWSSATRSLQTTTYTTMKIM